MFEILLIIILAAFAAGGIWAFVVTKKVREEGVETEAMVTRVEQHEWGAGTGEWAHGNVTEDYYITYTNRQGETVEALLSNPGSHSFRAGDRIRIRYMPDRQEYPVLVEILQSRRQKKTLL